MVGILRVDAIDDVDIERRKEKKIRPRTVNDFAREGFSEIPQIQCVLCENLREKFVPSNGFIKNL